MSQMDHFEVLIGGQFFGGACDQGMGKLVSKNPFNGSVVGTAAEGGWPEMDAAIDAATRAYSTWRIAPRHERSALLRSIASLVRNRNAQLVDLLTREVGKPVTWSQGEVTRLALTFDLAADFLTSPTGQILPTDFDQRGTGHRCSVERFPIGPVLAVTPYNWPYNLAAHKIAPALAMGNTVVMKPSSLAPVSSLALARLIHEAGCPDGVFNAVVCDDLTAEKAVTDPRVKVVSFTGSETVGWRVKSLVPEKHVTLELGGDATAIVMPDADLDWAVKRIVAGKFGYAGQICISVQHVLVHEDVYDLVRTKLVEATRECPTGDPQRPETVCGPLIHSEAAERVEAWIQEAVDSGATLLAGGDRAGNVVSPTLLEAVPTNAKLSNEEVFGPVLTLDQFSNLQQAIDRVNSSRFGIHCGVFTKDVTAIETCYQSLDVGGVVIGDFPTLRFDNMPYGGNKRSGFGREGIATACDEMSLPKVLLTRLV